MNRTEEKNVLLTLMELARLASRFGLAELPELVRMEREIEALEAAEAAATTATAMTTTENSIKKINVGVYTARVADRKVGTSRGVKRSTSSDCDSCASSVASTNTGFSTSSPSNAVLVDADVSRTDSSTLVEAGSVSNGTTTISSPLGKCSPLLLANCEASASNWCRECRCLAMIGRGSPFVLRRLSLTVPQ